MLSEMNGMLGQRPISDEELEKVKQQQILELPGSHETMNAVGTLIGDLLQFGLPLDFYDSYVSQLQELGKPEIERCAEALLNPARMVWLVVGDRTTIEPRLKELKIGEIIAAEA
jgi:zinc protease